MSTMPSDPPSETLAETSDLPDVERRRRRRDLVIAAAVMAAIGAVVVVERRITSLPEALPFGDSLLFLFLNAFNVVLIVLLIYLISRSFVKLVFERRSGVLGSHLNLKFALALFLVATVPMGLQYAVSSSFITASIDTWFSLQMDRAIDDSREVADAYYDAWTGNALHFGTQISEEIRAQRLLREGNNEELAAFVQVKQREYNLGVVQIFPFAEAEPIATLVNPEIPTAAFVKRDSRIVASALEGEQASVVEGTGTEIGDVIRGAVPIYSSDPARPQEVVGAVVVNHLVPHPLVYKVGAIRAALEEYRAIQPFTGRIAGVYQLVLLLFSLVIVLFALWWGLRMAKGVIR
jgi:two-component system nitrogen regulation sensor histidine kinase NtrY